MGGRWQVPIKQMYFLKIMHQPVSKPHGNFYKFTVCFITSKLGTMIIAKYLHSSVQH